MVPGPGISSTSPGQAAGHLNLVKCTMVAESVALEAVTLCLTLAGCSPYLASCARDDGSGIKEATP